MPAAPPEAIAPPIAEAPERTALAKVTRRLVPFLFLLYLVCFLDRVNIGFAALQMNRDLGFGPAVYGFGAGVFFLGYVLFEVPSNLILARMGARVWIARIMITWGLVAAAMVFVRGPLSLYGLRFLLGAAEAGFFPGIIYYLSGWFPAAERARAVARFMVAIPLSGVLGGPLSGALLGLNGHLGLAGWQWLFLLEGLPAMVLGLVVLGCLTDRPEEAAWLTPAERAWLSAHLSRESEHCERHHGLSVLPALSNRAVWQLGLLLLLCNAFGVYVLGLWLPQGALGPDRRAPRPHRRHRHRSGSRLPRERLHALPRGRRARAVGCRGRPVELPRPLLDPPDDLQWQFPQRAPAARARLACRRRSGPAPPRRSRPPAPG
jgi:ACS family tartrate transporter-like MFS transporter